MSEQYIHVYTTAGPLEAEMVRIFLESSGIKVITRQESAGATLGLTVGPLGEVKIYAPPEQAKNAKELLESMDKGQLVLPEDFVDENGEDTLAEEDD